MVRNYKRKTKRGNITEDAFLRAAKDVESKVCSMREAALKYKIPLATLHRVMKKKQLYSDNPQHTVGAGYCKHRRIFSDQQEVELVKHIETCASICNGLAPVDVRRLAYQFATVNNLKTTANWKSNQLASTDWFGAFMKRHPELTIRKPETKSLGGATEAKQLSIQEFMNNLQIVYKRLKSQINQQEC